jgi:tetratricopeptide (TPR) repeat protein
MRQSTLQWLCAAAMVGAALPAIVAGTERNMVTLERLTSGDGGDGPMARQIDTLTSAQRWHTSRATTVMLGDAYASAGRIADARDAYEAAGAAAIGQPLVALKTGRVYQRLGDRSRALEIWRRGGAAPYFVRQAFFEYRTDRIAESRDSYRTAVAIDPDVRMDPGERLGFGWVTASSGDAASAEAIFRQAVDRARSRAEQAEAAGHLGEFFRRTGRRDEAAVWLGRATELYPEAAGWHVGLALSSGDAAVAERELRTAIDLASGASPQWQDPFYPRDRPSLLAQLGSLYLEQRRFADAIRTYEEVRPLRPGDPDIHLWLGSAYAGAGRYRDAQREFDAVISAGTAGWQTEAAYLRSGDAHAAAGEWDAAIQTFERGLAAGPSDPGRFRAAIADAKARAQHKTR